MKHRLFLQTLPQIVELTQSLFQPELGLGSAQYEVTDIPEAAKTSSDGLASVEVFPTRAYPVTLPPKVISTEEEPRTGFVTIDKTTEGQDRETSTIAPKLVPRTIEKPPSNGPLITILVSLVFLFILILVIQVRSIMMFCLNTSLTEPTFRQPGALEAVLLGCLQSSARLETRTYPSGTESPGLNTDFSIFYFLKVRPGSYG